MSPGPCYRAHVGRAAETTSEPPGAPRSPPEPNGNQLRARAREVRTVAFPKPYCEHGLLRAPDLAMASPRQSMRSDRISFGRHQVLARLGQGGMGHVYLAMH